MSAFLPENRENDTQAGKLAKVISDMTPYIEEKISSMDVPGYDRDDLRQEALIALFSAVETYRSDGGASFSCSSRFSICSLVAMLSLPFG